MDTSTSPKHGPYTATHGATEGPRLDSRQRARLLEDCRELVLEKLSTVVAKALEKMAEDLTIEALKATRSDRQRALLDAVMLVREQRKSIEQNFRRYFADIFERRLFARADADQGPATSTGPVSADDLSLVSDEVISDKIDVDRLIQRARSRLDPNEVLGIRARLGALLERDWFDEMSHPAAPEAIYEALRIAVNELAPSVEVRNALLAAFEPHVTGNLNAVYSSVNGRLVANQILPKIKPRVGRPGIERSPGHGAHAGQPAGHAGADAGHASYGGSGAYAGARGYGSAGHGGVHAGTASPSALMELGQPGAITMSAGSMAALQQALMKAALGTPEGRGDAARMLADPGMFGMADLPIDPVQGPLLDSLTEVQREIGADARYRILENGAGAAEGAEGDPIGALMVMELLPLLLQKVKENGTPLDQMTVELVSVVFDYIYADKSLAEPVKHQLLRLQVVAVKAALLDRSFFARRQHPMRQLIDRITQLAADPDADLSVEAPLVKGLAVVVDELIAGFTSDLSSFLEAIDRIDELHQQEATRRASEIAAQLKAAEREEAYSLALEEARSEVAVRVDQETPAFIREFLLRWWTPVIARSRVEALASPGSREEEGSQDGSAMDTAGMEGAVRERRGASDGVAVDARQAAASTPEQKAMQVAEFLIWSVAPKHPEEISRLASLLPKLIRALAEGSRAVGVPQDERSAFMQELLEAHARVIDAAKQWQSGQPDPRPMGVRLRSDGSVRFSRSRRERDTGAPTISVGETALSSFERGDRIELIGDTGASQVYKLAWISPARKLFILSRYPKETLTFSSADFAALVSSAKARLVEGTGTVDQAIGEITREGSFTNKVH
ncbi:MAG: DUF1631 domain-containing protein [Burkholderiaceae bacterium]|nr:DUF1631 domain-containing protein [Burkholderiaceae bacterium]